MRFLVSIWFTLLTSSLWGADYFQNLEKGSQFEFANSTPDYFEGGQALLEKDFFQGYDLGSYFKGQTNSSGEKVLSSSLYQELSLSKNADADSVLIALQEKVTKQADDEKWLYHYARAMLHYASTSSFMNQSEAMIAQAKTYLEQVKNQNGSFGARARELYHNEFSSSASLEISKAESLLEKGSLDQAEALIRYNLHKNKFRNKKALAVLESILRTRARATTDAEVAAAYLAEANFIAKTLYEDEESSRIIDSTRIDTGISEPATEAQITRALEKATEYNNQGDEKAALQTLREAVLQSEFRSVRARLALASQYLKMAGMSQFSSNRAEYEKLGNLHLFEARNRKNKDLDQYPSNQTSATTADTLDDQLNRVSTESGLEEKVNQKIRTSLSRSENRNWTEAETFLKEALRISDQKSAKAWYFLGKLYMLQDKTQFAKEAFEKSVSLSQSFLSSFPDNGTFSDYSRSELESMQGSDTGNREQAMILPVHGTVTSPYGMRVHPIHKTRRMHTGLDIGAAHATPLKAMANGKVIFVGRNGGYGKSIKIEYDNGYTSMFAHLKDYKGDSGTTRKNQRVRQGEVVGRVNSTGSSTGDHLHLELFKDGNRISPAEVLGKKNVRGEKL